MLPAMRINADGNPPLSSVLIRIQDHSAANLDSASRSTEIQLFGFSIFDFRILAVAFRSASILTVLFSGNNSSDFQIITLAPQLPFALR